MNEIVEAINRLGETSWMDYVQLGATVVGIIISALAVFYAVKVPKKIAKEQNRIALFEKRNDVYSRLSEMFHNRPLMSVALFNCYDASRKTTPTFNNYVFWGKQRADRALLFEVSFLFTNSIDIKIKEMIDLVDRFYWNEKLLEEGYAQFDDNDLKVYYDESIDSFLCDDYSNDTLRKISDKYPLKSSEFFLKNKMTYYVYELEAQQREIADKAKRLQDEVLNEIVTEMRIYASK